MKRCEIFSLLNIMFDTRDLIIIFLLTVIFLLLVNQNQKRENFKNKKLLKHSSIY